MAARKFEIKTLTTLQEIEEIRSLWNAMQGTDPESDVDFVSFIIAARPEIIRPHVLVVFEAGKPVALLAARLEKGRFEIKCGYKVLWKTNIRRIAVFYGGLMGQLDDLVREAVIRFLLLSLRQERADLLMWSGVHHKSPLQRQLLEIPNFFLRDRTATPVKHWTMKMPASLDELLHQRLNKKQRYNAKRALQTIEKVFPGQVRYGSYSTLAEVDDFFKNVVEVAKRTYQWGLGVGFQGSKENKERLILEAKRGWFRGYMLFVKDQPVAFWICTVYNGTVYLDYTGYDPTYRTYEVGTALLLRLISELAPSALAQLDFGPGTAFYKEQFGDAAFEETALCTFSSTPRGIALCALNWLTNGPLTLSRGLLRRLGLEQKVKRIWRRCVLPKSAPNEPPRAQASPNAGNIA